MKFRVHMKPIEYTVSTVMIDTTINTMTNVKQQNGAQIGCRRILMYNNGITESGRVKSECVWQHLRREGAER